jgi:hypothetical protein
MHRRRRGDEFSDGVSFNQPLASADRMQQFLPIKRSRPSTPFLNEQNPQETIISWVNHRLSITDCADVERIRTKFRSNGTGFREFFYRTVLQGLNQNTCAQILELWIDTMDYLFLDMLHSRLLHSKYTSPMGFNGYGMYFQKAFF